MTGMQTRGNMTLAQSVEETKAALSAAIDAAREVIKAKGLTEVSA